MFCVIIAKVLWLVIQDKMSKLDKVWALFSIKKEKYEKIPCVYDGYLVVLLLICFGLA